METSSTGVTGREVGLAGRVAQPARTTAKSAVTMRCNVDDVAFMRDDVSSDHQGNPPMMDESHDQFISQDPVVSSCDNDANGGDRADLAASRQGGRTGKSRARCPASDASRGR